MHTIRACIPTAACIVTRVRARACENVLPLAFARSDTVLRKDILRALASAAGVVYSPEATLVVTPASVRIEAVLPVADAVASASATALLTSTLNSAAAATALFANAGLPGVVAETAVTVTRQTPVVAPSPPTSPPPSLPAPDSSEEEEETGLPIAIVGGGAGGAALLALLICIFVFRTYRRQQLRAKTGPTSSAFTDVEATLREELTLATPAKLPIPVGSSIADTDRVPRADLSKSTPRPSQRVDAGDLAEKASALKNTPLGGVGLLPVPKLTDHEAVVRRCSFYVVQHAILDRTGTCTYIDISPFCT